MTCTDHTVMKKSNLSCMWENIGFELCFTVWPLFKFDLCKKIRIKKKDLLCKLSLRASNTHILGLWDETWVTAESPCRHEDSMPSPQTGPWSDKNLNHYPCCQTAFSVSVRLCSPLIRSPSVGCCCSQFFCCSVIQNNPPGAPSSRSDRTAVK